MTINFATERIRIVAPDASAALALERRLSHLHPTAVGRQESWLVELEDDGDRLDEVLAAVRHWLREEGLESTSVVAGGATHEIKAAAGGALR